MLDDAAARLRAAFVAAYRPYLAARVAALGVTLPAGWDDALGAAEAWLDEELAALLAAAPAAQARGPLEVFQEAMRFPTATLAAAGTPDTRRDPVAVAALPGDRYDLAPATSQVLGEEAWRAHLAWGAAKAAALAAGPRAVPARPCAGVLSIDLVDRSRIEPAARAAGLAFCAWNSATDVSTAGLVVACVDLTHGDALEVIGRLSPRILTIAYGPHVDDDVFAAARDRGAAEVLARSVFFRRLPGLFPRLV